MTRPTDIAGLRRLRKDWRFLPNEAEKVEHALPGLLDELERLRNERDGICERCQDRCEHAAKAGGGT